MLAESWDQAHRVACPARVRERALPVSTAGPRLGDPLVEEQNAGGSVRPARTSGDQRPPGRAPVRASAECCPTA